MYSLTKCPDEDTLRRHLLGRIRGEAARQLDAHFESCSTCLATAEKIELSDDWLDRVARAGELKVAQDDEVSCVIQQVRDSCIRAETMAGNQTMIDDGTGHIPVPSLFIGSDSEDVLAEYVGVLNIGHDASQPPLLGDYRVFEVIGRGGMGVVFRAEDVRLRRPVALKLMRPQLAVVRSERQRFMREARAAAAVRDDNVADVYEVGEFNELPFIAMPLLQGETLQQRLNREGRLPESEVIRIGMEILSGLSAAHAADLVHRDIKPENVWLEEPNGRVKLLDFGLVRPVQTEAEITHDGAILGTPRYMAPEQASTMPVDQRCDLFSVGSVLYRAVTGKSPFSGTSSMECMAAVMSEKEPAAHRVFPVSRQLSAILTRLLQKNPEDRFQTAEEVHAALSDAESRAKKRTSFRSLAAGVGVTAALLILLGVIIIRVTNPDGSITEYTIPDGSGVQVDLTKSESAGVVEVKTADGKTVEVKPEMNPSTAPTSEAGIAADLMKRGSTVTVRDFAGTVSTLSGADELPLNLKVLNVMFRDQTVSARDVAVLANLRTLEGLEFERSKVQTDAWAALSALKTVQHISIRTDELPIRDLQALKTIPGLVHLQLLNDRYVAGTLAALAEFPQLSILTVGGRADDRDLAGLEKLNSVWMLNLTGGGELTNDLFRHIALMKGLKRLNLAASTTLSGDCLSVLKNPDLEALSVGFPVSDDELLSLSGRSSLQSLELYHSRFSPKALAALLGKLPNLRRLDLRSAATSAAHFAALSTSKSLKALSISILPLSNETADELKKLTILEELQLHPDCVHDAVLPDIHAALPKCDVHPQLPDTETTVADWLMNIGAPFEVDGPDGKRFDGNQKLPEDFRIHSADLSGDLAIGPQDLKYLRGTRALKRLKLSPKVLSPLSLSYLASLTSLEGIELSGGEFDSDLMPDVAKLPQLNHLSFLNSATGRAGIEALAETPKLHVILFRGDLITDSMCAGLPKLPHLKEVSIIETGNVTNEAFRYIRLTHSLRTVYVRDVPRITGTAIQQLKGHAQLERLGFQLTSVSDDAFVDALQLPALDWLALERTAVTADGIAKLRGVPRLSRILLGGEEAARGVSVGVRSLSQVKQLFFTNASLNEDLVESLRPLQHLSTIDFGGGNISPQQLSELKRALPDCELKVH